MNSYLHGWINLLYFLATKLSPILERERLMKARVWLAGLLLIIPGCAAYKELEPKPDILPVEDGYIELKKDQGNFELDKDKKYFIKFPSPSKSHFYLVLVTRNKTALHSYLTDRFDDGKGEIVPIVDEAVSSDSISVYAIDAHAPTYFWVIDGVRQDLVLTMRYRYVPQWRYTFESRYAEFQNTLASSTVDQTTYNSIDINFDFEHFDFMHEVPYVQERTQKVKSMKDELLKLETIFPPDIAAGRDTAYEKYVTLRKKVDDELTFQENYLAVMNLFKRETETRGNTQSFLDAVPYFTETVSQRERFPARIIVKASQVLLKRLGEVTPYFDGIVKNKGNMSVISPEPSLDTISKLYQACGQPIDGGTESILQFITRFNVETGGLQASNAKFEALKAYFSSHVNSPSETFCDELISKVNAIKTGIPESRASRFERYGSYSCAVMLGRELTNASNRAGDLLTVYQAAASVSAQISSHAWAPAESQLRALNDAPSYSDYPEVPAHRTALVRRFENQVFTEVKDASRQRIDAFIKAHEMAIDNVPSLYADSAFLPVYRITFSSLGPADLQEKRKQIDGYLDDIKYNQFPESSIKAIYAEFTRNPRERGVEKARAIVEHGKFYKGDDTQVKGLITECDVEAAKWIIKPREYRKLFALPVTSNRQGVNEYMFRVRLQIPSDAQFPVFDVNVKLPQEVAEKSGQQQWFESITIDKQPIKNEGRFRVTSPTAENNYEALITPVQMDKEGKNILEVRFKYPGFRVFEVSTMAQVPIIRKN